MRSNKTAVTVIILGLSLLFGARQADAQALYGSIVGQITDSSGAAVPGATVRVIQVETNESRQSETNESGGYTFPDLRPGSYQVSVSKSGFRTVAHQGVAVSVNSVVRMDVALEVGAISESVQVKAESMTLQTDRSEVRSDVPKRYLEDMPMPANRNYQNLLITVPGLSPPANQHSVSASPSRALTFSANGTTRNSNNVRIEGATALNVWLPHVSAYVPGLEAIETVNVVTSSLDADQGLTGGAAVNVLLKSGTNQVHGSVFEYHTDNSLKAKPFFLPTGERKPKYIDNQLGATIGGPIKRNKIFYFLSYDGQFNRQTGAVYTTVPTAAILSGDMSGSNNPLYDPFTGNSDGSGKQPFAGNRVPASRMDPIALKVAALAPQPTWPNLLQNNYYATGSYRVSRSKYDWKTNWQASEKLSLAARMGALDYEMINPPAFGTNGPPVNSAGGREGHGFGTVFNGTVSGIYLVGPHFVVDSYFGYTRLNTGATPPLVEKNMGQELGIPGTNGSRIEYGGYPTFSVSSYSALGKATNPNPIWYLDPAYDYVANGNWTRGAHSLRFGFDIARQMMNNFDVSGAGSFSFSGGATTIRNGPSPNQYNSYADFLLGLLSGGSKSFSRADPPRERSRNWAFSFYVRDQWQASRKLTLSYGLRWDYLPMGNRGNGLGFQKYDWDNNVMLVCGIGGIPLDCGVKVPKRDFGPRLGIAYRATERFVIRAGFGINYDSQPESFNRNLLEVYPEVLSSGIAAAPNSYTAAGFLKDGLPPVVMPDVSKGRIAIPGTTSVITIPDKISMGYVESWNFTLQRQLKWGFVAQAGYVGTRQIHSLQYVNLNAGEPGGGTASQPLYKKFGRSAATNMEMPYGNYKYDSLQATLGRSFAQGVQFQAAYTFSKARGLCCDEASDGNPAINHPSYSFLNRSLANWDRTHVLVLSSVADLPFGKGKRLLANGGVASALASNWRFSSMLSSYVGTPFTVSSASTSLNAPGNNQRADLVRQHVAILGGAGPNQSYFDPFAFAPVTAARFGTAGFNIVRGPGLVNLDLNLAREFRMGERFRLQFRASALNSTNTPHFANPGANVSNMVLNNDGTIRSLGGYTVITATTGTGREGIDERVFVLGLRVGF